MFHIYFLFHNSLPGNAPSLSTQWSRNMPSSFLPFNNLITRNDLICLLLRFPCQITRWNQMPRNSYSVSPFPFKSHRARVDGLRVLWIGILHYRPTSIFIRSDFRIRHQNPSFLLSRFLFFCRCYANPPLQVHFPHMCKYCRLPPTNRRLRGCFRLLRYQSPLFQSTYVGGYFINNPCLI